MPRIFRPIVVLLVTGLAAFFALRWLVELVSPMPETLGVVNGRLAPCPSSPNCVSTADSDAEHGIEPIPFGGETAVARSTILSLLEANPQITVITASPTYIHAEARSTTWQFIDDVEFYFDDAAELIHFRSAARLGYGDGGVNRRRMEGIRSAFQAAP